VGNDSQVTRNREVGVSRYLTQGRYTDTGLEGPLAVGGTSRRMHFEQNVSSLDGSVEAFYYAFGGEDIYAIVELPEGIAAAALTMAIGSGGGFRANTTVLLTPEEVDMAAEKALTVGYRPPGG
jgi:uncharacterized protein with GYD domain